MGKSVLLYSGGLDSLIGYYYLKFRDEVAPIPVYVPLGHRYEKKEIAAMHNIFSKGGPLPTLDQGFNLGVREEPNANIPQRNMFLAMTGAYYGDDIYVVCQKGEQDIPDRGPEFFTKSSDMISFLMGKKISVSPLFPDHTKTQMVKWYLREGFDVEILKSSVSCYSPEQDKQCGVCSSCFRRWVSMYLNGIDEQYAHNPWEWEGVQGYIERINNNVYIKERSDDILMALKKKGVI
jgi:7-cyano-7-deazaguanine synthase in queuosine biosynthesis